MHDLDALHNIDLILACRKRPLRSRYLSFPPVSTPRFKGRLSQLPADQYLKLIRCSRLTMALSFNLRENPTAPDFFATMLSLLSQILRCYVQ